MKVGQWLGSEVDKNPKSLKSFSVVHLEQFRSASNFGIRLKKEGKAALSKKSRSVVKVTKAIYEINYFHIAGISMKLTKIWTQFFRIMALLEIFFVQTP